jgi:hypothetical protein
MIGAGVLGGADTASGCALATREASGNNKQAAAAAVADRITKGRPKASR